MNQTIGILGGMGPRATVVFEQMLLARLQGSDQDLPRIVTINDGSIPDRSSFLLGFGENPVPRMAESLRLLEIAGSTIICMPCNTACAPLILQRLQRMTAIPILNLPLETAELLVQNNVRSVFVLATAGTVKTRVYQNICDQLGINCIVPNARVQAAVDTVIHAIKQNDLATASIAAIDVEGAILASSCQTVILGCTELPLAKDVLIPMGITAIDTLEVLADACVSYTNKLVMEKIT